MEHYATYLGHSMSMGEDPVLTAALTKLIAEEGINVAIETGTYLGLGSTRFIADCLVAAHPREHLGEKTFITIEASKAHWRQAVVNLIRYPFMKCVWGTTVDIEAAAAFMANDDMLVNHQNYQGIYIDTLDDPVGAYGRELRGMFNSNEPIPDNQQGLLQRYLLKHGDDEPLIILDSAGGIGLLEFNIVTETMAGRTFHLLLDDTHHVKHYRSLQAVEADLDFRIVAKGYSWVLASYR